MSATFDLPFAADVTGKSQVRLSAEGSHALICFNSFTKVGGWGVGGFNNERGRPPDSSGTHSQELQSKQLKRIKTLLLFFFWDHV